MAAAASLGMILQWDVDKGFDKLSKYIYMSDPHIKGGALLGMGMSVVCISVLFCSVCLSVSLFCFVCLYLFCFVCLSVCLFISLSCLAVSFSLVGYVLCVLYIS